jgi:hypothetical protein
MNGSLRTLLVALVALSLIACSGDGTGTVLSQTDGGASPGVGVGVGDGSGSAGECWEGIKLCEGGGVKTCVGGLWSAVDPCLQGGCSNGECTDCVPDCEGKGCGTNGCGGSCGDCGGEVCEDGQCPCTPDCEGRVCGGDGCGGSCGFCSGGLACAGGECSCAPDCAGKDCGPDGCGGQCGICQGDFECSAQSECVPAAYRAVLIQGHWNTSNDCSDYNSSGADIDAVTLYDAGGELIGYFAEVIEEVGKDECTNSYTDPDTAVGPPDDSNNSDDYIALQGGWIMGRFDDYLPIQSGMSLVVHERFSAERYSVYLATGFDCAESDDPGACSLLISDQGQGTTEVQVP